MTSPLSVTGDAAGAGAGAVWAPGAVWAKEQAGPAIAIKATAPARDLARVEAFMVGFPD